MMSLLMLLAMPPETTTQYCARLEATFPELA